MSALEKTLDRLDRALGKGPTFSSGEQEQILDGSLPVRLLLIRKFGNDLERRDAEDLVKKLLGLYKRGWGPIETKIGGAIGH